jgi:hypothetical protein
VAAEPPQAVTASATSTSTETRMCAS